MGELRRACAIELRAVLGSDGTIAAWDREAWVAALGSRPGYDRPGNIITGMLLGHEPEPLAIGPAAPAKGKLDNRSNAVPPYVAGCVAGACGGEGTIRSERVVTHTVRSPLFTGPLRSPLRIQNTFANESFMDELALAAGTDPIDFRLRHLSSERARKVIETAARMAGWNAREKNDGSKGRGIGFAQYKNASAYCAVVAEVEVGEKISLRRVFAAVDAGQAVNPDGIRNQIEGGIVQAASWTLKEQVSWEATGVRTRSWEDYPILRFDEVPEIQVEIVERPGEPSLGTGECAAGPTAAAIANALFHAMGVRVRDLPLTPERVARAM